MNQQITQYFENVLGIKKILLESSTPVLVTKYLVVHMMTPVNQPAQQELLGKMLEALNWRADEIQLMEVDSMTSPDDLKNLMMGVEFEHGLLFSDQDWANSFSDMMMVLTPPQVLLQKPELKRDVWNKIKILRVN